MHYGSINYIRYTEFSYFILFNVSKSTNYLKLINFRSVPRAIYGHHPKYSTDTKDKLGKIGPKFG